MKIRPFFFGRLLESKDSSVSQGAAAHYCLGVFTKTFGLALGLSIAGISSQSAQATSNSWNVDAAGNWATAGSWLGGIDIPGATGGSTTSTDIATFGNVITAARLVTVDTGRNIFGIDFAGNSSAYTLQTGSLVLTTTGYIQVTGGGSGHTDTVSAAITLAGNASFISNSTTATRLLAITGNVTGSATGTSTLTLGGTNTSTSNTVSGIVANGAGGALSIVKNDAGSWNISNNSNSYSGGTTINAGTVRTSAVNGLGSGATTLVAGSTLQIATASAIASTVGGTGTVEFTNGSNTTIGNLSGNGTLSLVNKAGVGSAVADFATSTLTSFTGKLILSRNNTANGSFRFNGGASAYAGAVNTWFDLTDNVTLTRRETQTTNDTINLGSLSGTAGTSLYTTNRNTTWAIGARGDNTEFAGVIALGSFTSTVRKVGTASLTLSGANTYTGLTTVQAGKLVAGTDSLVSTNGAFGNAASAIVVGNGSTLVGDAPTLLINGAFNVARDITVGSLTNTNAYNATLGGSNAAGTSQFTGNITLNTTAANYTATLQAATSGTVDFNTGTWTTNNKAIAIGSSGNTGTVQLSNAIATSGGISVNFGTLALNNAFTGGNMTVSSGTALKGTGSVAGTTGVTSGTINGTGLVLTGLTTFNSTGNVMSGSETATAGVALASGAALANSATVTGGIAVGNGTLTGTGGAFSGASTLNGGTINLTSGSFGSTLEVTGGNWNGAGSVTGAVTSSSGTFNIGSGANLTANGDLNVTGGTIASTDVTGTITGSLNYTSANDSNFAGVIAGSGKTVTMNSSGQTLTLTGTNTYNGATQVNAGTLLVGTSGSLGNSAVTVGGASAAGTPTLSGGGTIGGATTLSAASGGVAGTHAVGVAGVNNGVGSQTFSSTLTYETSSIFEWDLHAASTSDIGVVADAATGTYDTVLANGAVTGGAAIFKVVLGGNAFTDAFWNSDKSWTNIFTGTGAPALLSSVFNGFSATGGLAADGTVAGIGQFTFNGSTATLNWTSFSAVPEPTSALAGLLIGVGALRRNRRRVTVGSGGVGENAFPHVTKRSR